MTKFREYLKGNGKTIGSIAGEVGISYSYMADLVRHEAVPSVEVAVKIERATDGAIPVEHWVQDAGGAG